MSTILKQSINYEAVNHSIFEKIVASYQVKILSYIQRLVGDPELSADILQDTFLAVYVSLFSRNEFNERINQAEFLNCIQPYIYTVARNKAIDVLRRRNNFRCVPLKPITHNSEFDTWPGDIDPVIEYKLADPGRSLENTAILNDELKTAIELIGRHKLISLFLYLNGFSYKEIGQITGESMSSVKTKIFRCKQSLRLVLEKNLQST